MDKRVFTWGVFAFFAQIFAVYILGVSENEKVVVGMAIVMFIETIVGGIAAFLLYMEELKRKGLASFLAGGGAAGTLLTLVAMGLWIINTVMGH